MTLIVAGGGEERHTSASRAVGPWIGSVGITLITTSSYTGAAYFQWGGPLAATAGTSPSSTYGSKCWWSGATIPWTANNGTYWTQFNILLENGGAQRFLTWKFNGGYHLALCSNNSGTALATSSSSLANPAFVPFKLEFDDDAWTLWADFGGGWQSEFTYTDTTSAPYTFRLDLNGTTNESKASSGPGADDVLMWDSSGDNWNSRIATMSDFPRVSVAHLPDLVSESDAGQATNLDEMPANHTDTASVNATGYWATFPALDASVTNTIQAVMVTHVAGANPDQLELAKYNIRENGTVYANAEDAVVQKGDDSQGASAWVTWAGYFPWTPEENAWTSTNFGTCDYGVSLINAKSSQITVQAISFGSAAEWPVPGAAAARRVFIMSSG